MKKEKQHTINEAFYKDLTEKELESCEKDLKRIIEQSNRQDMKEEYLKRIAEITKLKEQISEK